MKGRALLLLLAACGGVTPAVAQDRAAAEAAGRDLGTAAQAQAGAMVRDNNAPSNIVPGFAGTSLPEGSLVDDPERLISQGAYAVGGNESYNVIIDKDRPVFDPTTIDLTRATEIEQDPDKYIGAGLTADGTTSKCEPLPPATGVGSEYLQICNAGLKPEQTTEICRIPLVPQFSGSGAIKYTCGRQIFDTDYRGTWEPGGEESSCTGFQSAPQCSLQGEEFSVTRQYLGRVGNGIYLYRSESVRTYTCTSPTSSPNGGALSNTFGSWTPAPVVEVGRERGYSGSVEDFSACSEPVKKGQCSLESSECVDSEPTTRVIDGIPVTQACWTKSNTYKCDSMVSANDCAELEANAKCRYDHEDCLDDPQEGACKVKNLYYRCKADPASAPAETAYICSGDLYCINGECTKIEREASTEFKDAMVAVQTLGQIKEDFDPDTLTLFNGQQAGCHKPIFGLVNCCAGKVSGLIPVATGAAALAGGPVAIAGLATPFLTLFLCGAEEKMLDVKDRMGMCHYVDTYCSEKVLGVCTTRRSTYCCYESKLARILQEQGRPQIGKSWGTGKEPKCQGFTIEEFQQLDLSKMDFTEVFDEFVNAATVPDAVQTSIEIQTKIEEYYKLHAKP